MRIVKGRGANMLHLGVKGPVMRRKVGCGNFAESNFSQFDPFGDAGGGGEIQATRSFQVLTPPTALSEHVSERDTCSRALMCPPRRARNTDFESAGWVRFRPTIPNVTVCS